MRARQIIVLGERDHVRLWGFVLASPDQFDDLCWLWRGKHNPDGYAMFSIGRRWFRASRVMWVAVNGPLAPGDNVLHKCDTPGCVRPTHLFTGTQADNAADMVRKGRSRGGSPHGVANPNAKLTEPDVHLIRSLAAADQSRGSQNRLAERFGVTRGAIQAIVHRKTWRHLP